MNLAQQYRGHLKRQICSEITLVSNEIMESSLLECIDERAVCLWCKRDA